MADRVTPGVTTDQRPSGPPPIVLLGAMSAMGALGTHTLMPALPGLVHEFGTTPELVQMTISIFLISIAVSQIVVGPIADRFGRRTVLMTGLTIFILSSIGCAFATSIDLLIAGRILQGASSCVGLVVARLLLRDLFSRGAATSKLGFITTCVSLVPTTGPIVGGLLFQTYGWTGIFWFLALFAGVIMLGAAILVREPGRPATAAPVPLPIGRAYGTLLRNPDFMGFFAIIGIITGTFYAFASGAPYIGQRFLGLEPAEYGLWFAPVALGNTLGAFLAGKLGTTIAPTRLLSIGSVITVLGSGLAVALFLAGYRTPLFLFGPMSLGNIGTGLIVPSAVMAGVSAVPGIAGTSAGLVGLSQFGSAALFSFIAGALVQRSGSALPLLSVILGMTVLIAILSFWASSRFGRSGEADD